MKQQGKRAIVVGASSGLGKEVAKILIEQGWTVGVAARRGELLHNIGADNLSAPKKSDFRVLSFTD